MARFRNTRNGVVVNVSAERAKTLGPEYVSLEAGAEVEPKPLTAAQKKALAKKQTAAEEAEAAKVAAAEAEAAKAEEAKAAEAAKAAENSTE